MLNVLSNTISDQLAFNIPYSTTKMTIYVSWLVKIQHHIKHNLGYTAPFAIYLAN